jgi:hypothetical protein
MEPRLPDPHVPKLSFSRRSHPLETTLSHSAYADAQLEIVHAPEEQPVVPTLGSVVQLVIVEHDVPQLELVFIARSQPLPVEPSQLP